MKNSPIVVALVSALLGCASLLAGVYLLAGPGWALVGGGLSFLVFALVILRGLGRAE